MNTEGIKVFFYIITIAAIIALVGLLVMIFSDGYTWLNIAITTITFLALGYLAYRVYKKVRL